MGRGEADLQALLQPAEPRVVTATRAVPPPALRALGEIRERPSARALSELLRWRSNLADTELIHAVEEAAAKESPGALGSYNRLAARSLTPSEESQPSEGEFPVEVLDELEKMQAEEGETVSGMFNRCPSAISERLTRSSGVLQWGAVARELTSLISLDPPDYDELSPETKAVMSEASPSSHTLALRRGWVGWQVSTVVEDLKSQTQAVDEILGIHRVGVVNSTTLIHGVGDLLCEKLPEFWEEADGRGVGVRDLLRGGVRDFSRDEVLDCWEKTQRWMSGEWARPASGDNVDTQEAEAERREAIKLLREDLGLEKGAPLVGSPQLRAYLGRPHVIERVLGRAFDEPARGGSDRAREAQARLMMRDALLRPYIAKLHGR